MSYEDMTTNKNPKVDFQKYLGNFEEPEDKIAHDRLDIPAYEQRMDPYTMRDNFRRMARKLRDL